MLGNVDPWVASQVVGTPVVEARCHSVHRDGPEAYPPTTTINYLLIPVQSRRDRALGRETSAELPNGAEKP